MSMPRDDGGAQFVAASLGLPGNMSIPFSADAKGILTSADTDTAYVGFEERVEGWHLPGKFLAGLLKAAEVIAELGKEYVLIKIILSAQHVLNCICTEQR